MVTNHQPLNGNLARWVTILLWLILTVFTGYVEWVGCLSASVRLPGKEMRFRTKPAPSVPSADSRHGLSIIELYAASPDTSLPPSVPSLELAIAMPFHKALRVNSARLKCLVDS